MDSKNSFVIYDNWASLLCDLPNEQAGELIKAICAYKLGQFETLDDPVISAIFNMIKQKLDEDSKKYQEACERKREAAKRGGAPTGNTNAKKQPDDLKNNQKQPNGCLNNHMLENSNQKQPKTTKNNQKQHDTDTVTDTDNDTDTVTDTVNDLESRAKAPRSFVPPTLDEVKDYCWERNNGIDAQRFVDFYESKGWMIGKDKMKDWKAAVRNWEQRSRDKPVSNVVNAADDFFADIKGAMNGL